MKILVTLALIIQFEFLQAQQHQTSKMGYADIDYIYKKLPESKQIDAELKSLQIQLENQLKIKYKEFENRYQYHIGREKTMTPAELQNAQKELQELKVNLQKTEQDSQTKFQERHKQLIEPVTQKIHKAIGDVARENNYAFIFNAGADKQDLLLHADEAADVSDLILKKMTMDTVSLTNKN
ncbi:OmpH family outer membrane protein [Chryseolinea sp. H1M3-3]|uniref:OmpH family outer membrane protein n=1 Tax=Chryseolinea sp. H1M3-3 TaxID=3034144 RepID=UPI0023EAD6EA|nr:OmpH family outer membrane protein [Chryseolinea sp. H1M3-3]